MRWSQIQAGLLNAAEPIDRLLDYLAVGVAAVINIFNPNKLFIYGRFLDASSELFPQLLERSAQHALGQAWPIAKSFEPAAASAWAWSRRPFAASPTAGKIFPPDGRSDARPAADRVEDETVGGDVLVSLPVLR